MTTEKIIERIARDYAWITKEQDRDNSYSEIQWNAMLKKINEIISINTLRNIWFWDKLPPSIENISKIIVNHNYIEENLDFFEKVVFKLWENYYNSVLEPISIRKQLGMFELFLATMIEMKPAQELPEDSIDSL